MEPIYSITEKNTSFLATALTSVTSQEILDQINEAIQSEMAYWTDLLTNATDSIGMFKMVKNCMEALEYENGATKDITNAIQAENDGLYAEASVCYARAQSDIYFALSSWNSALPEIADDSPFDTYMPTTAERKKYEEQKYEIKRPTRTSYADLLKISPFLHHVYRSMDRLHCLGLSLTQYQMAHLNTFLIEAEQHQA